MKLILKNKKQKGIALIELALLTPVLITTYIGILAMGDYFQATRKLDRTVSFITNYVSNVSSLTTNDLTAIETIAGKSMKGFLNSNGVDIAIISLSVYGNRTSLRWCYHNTVSRTRVSLNCPSYNIKNIQSAFVANGGGVIVQMKLPYTPLKQYTIGGTQATHTPPKMVTLKSQKATILKYTKVLKFCNQSGCQ